MNVKTKNYGVNKNTEGCLVVINQYKNLDKIKKGNLVFFRIKDDLLAYVVTAFDKGCRGFIGNCGITNHGVIAAKELNLPFLSTDYDNFKENKTYYISDALISDNPIKKKNKEVNINDTKLKILKTKKKLFINLGFPNRTFNYNSKIAKYIDGVGFARLEFVLLEILDNLHPIDYLCKYGTANFISNIVNHFDAALKYFNGKRFWIRTDDFSSNQLIELKGGNKYENHTANEIVGFRGIARAIDIKWNDLGNFNPKLKNVSWIKLQFKVINKLIIKYPKVRFGIFAPMIHDISEYKKWKTLAQLEIKQKIDFGIMVEVPALTGKGILPFLKEKIINFMIFGTNDLTALTLGIDRSDSRCQYLFNEEHPRVLESLIKTIKFCKRYKVLTAIGGAAASKKTLMQKLYKADIDIYSVSPNLDVINQSREILRNLEKKNE